MLEIKREIWNHKYFTVIRDDKGQIVTKKKWERGDKNRLREFKHKGTLKKNVVKTKLVNVTEIVDFNVDIKEDKITRLPKIPTPTFQYVIEGKLNDGRMIVARSRQKPTGTSKRAIREEARINFFSLLADAFGEDYDHEIGFELQDRVKSVNEGVVYYV